MKESSLLRFLDRYVGTCLCFLLSLFRRVRPYNPNPRRILVTELFEMGASIVAIPAIRHIKSRQPHAEIYILTTVGNRSSWDISGLIEEANVICLDGGSLWRFIRTSASAVLRMRSLRLDLSIDLEKFSRVSVILSVLSGVRRIAGFYRYEYEGLYRGKNLIDVPCAFNQNSHMALNFLALAKASLSPTLSYPNFKEAFDLSELSIPIISSAPERSAAIRDSLGLSDSSTLVLICPDVGGNLQIRNYPVESYARVAQALLDDSPHRHVALIGVNSNQAICSRLEALIGSPRVHNLCGATQRLSQLIDLISASELLIGNDNGPLHFASLTKTPILGIYSTDSPFMYGPLGDAVVLYTFFHCSPCISALNHKRSRCRDSLCISSIPPDEVADMAKRLIRGEVALRTINGVLPYLPIGGALIHGQPLVSIRERVPGRSPHAEDWRDEFVDLP